MPPRRHRAPPIHRSMTAESTDPDAWGKRARVGTYAGASLRALLRRLSTNVKPRAMTAVMQSSDSPTV